MRSMRVLLVVGAALSVAGFLACKGGDDDGPTGTSDTPTTTTTTTTLPGPGVCSPTPSPLYRIEVTVQNQGDGHVRTLKATVKVANTNDYCDRVSTGGQDFCPTRFPDDPQKAACDAMAVGQAVDTGRWGPYWKYALHNLEYPCTDTDPGCRNHADNQYLVVAKGGTIKLLACANPSVPMAPNPDGGFMGRCGICMLDSSSDSNCS